jgi:hypothetical protein
LRIQLCLRGLFAGHVVEAEVLLRLAVADWEEEYDCSSCREVPSATRRMLLSLRDCSRALRGRNRSATFTLSPEEGVYYVW